MFAFFVWNLDNLLCVQSTHLKQKLGIPLAWALEGEWRRKGIVVGALTA